MTPRVRAAVFLLGAVLFALLIRHAGPARILANLRQAGWVLVPICLLWVPVYACRAAAWQLCMGQAPGRPPYWRTVVISSVTYAVNLVTPFVQAGGEVLRVSAMTPWLGKQRATGSTVTYYMLHSLSNMIMWLLSLVLLLLLVPLSAPLTIAFSVTGLLIVALIAFVFSRHQQGVVAPIERLLSRIPLVRRLVKPLEARRDRLEELDRVITGFYHEAPARFFLALAIDVAGRTLATAEYWLTAWALGIHIGASTTLIIAGLGGLIVNVIFFVPLETGVKEGGLYGAFHLVGLDPALGIFAAIVQRLREFVWIAIGLAFVPLAGGRTKVAE